MRAAVRPGGWAAGWVLLVIAHSSVLLGQSAERLYEAGAYRAAADSFASRARLEPLVAAHWFNLGDAFYRAGDNVAARAAWVRAARLDPREPEVDVALRLAPATDVLTQALVPVEPFTPSEGWIGAVALWALAWALVARRARRRFVLVPLILAALAAGWALRAGRRYEQPVALVRRANTPLRSAPYASAASHRAVNDGVAVLVTRTRGAWLLVRRGAEWGWLLESEVVRL